MNNKAITKGPATVINSKDPSCVISFLNFLFFFFIFR